MGIPGLNFCEYINSIEKMNAGVFALKKLHSLIIHCGLIPQVALFHQPGFSF